MSPGEKERSRGSCLAFGLSLIVALASIVVLVFLSSGLLLFVVVVAGLVFAFAAFHYVVWGWWLSRIIRQEEREAEMARRRLPDEDSQQP